MVKAVLTTRVNPDYDDLPESHYHFPRTYLRQVERAVGDWIVYYEPRRLSNSYTTEKGRQVYFATARIKNIEADPTRQNHYYASIEDYIEFNRPVRFEEGGHFYESLLVKADGSTNKGAFGRAVRNLSDSEYDLILQAGFAHILGKEPRNRPFPDVAEAPLQTGFGLHETADEWGELQQEVTDRPLIQQLVARRFRDRAFTTSVKSAYNDTCAITGLKIINGSGRSEVQAAHIRPVSEAGPDSVRNGLALSGTVHWMFDRGLLSIEDNYEILVAKDRLPDTIERLIHSDGKLPCLKAQYNDRIPSSCNITGTGYLKAKKTKSSKLI